jgi:hypothetical protein
MVPAANALALAAVLAVPIDGIASVALLVAVFAFPARRALR